MLRVIQPLSLVSGMPANLCCLWRSLGFFLWPNMLYNVMVDGVKSEKAGGGDSCFLHVLFQSISTFIYIIPSFLLRCGVSCIAFFLFRKFKFFRLH